jgi:hypothetical protein
MRIGGGDAGLRVAEDAVWPQIGDFDLQGDGEVTLRCNGAVEGVPNLGCAIHIIKPAGAIFEIGREPSQTKILNFNLASFWVLGQCDINIPNPKKTSPNASVFLTDEAIDLLSGLPSFLGETMFGSRNRVRLAPDCHMILPHFLIS